MSAVRIPIGWCCGWAHSKPSPCLTWTCFLDVSVLVYFITGHMLSVCGFLSALVGWLRLYTTLRTHCWPWMTSQFHRGDETFMWMKAKSRANTLLEWMKGGRYKVNCDKRWRKANGLDASLWGKGCTWLMGRKRWGRECTNLSKTVHVCRICLRGRTCASPPGRIRVGWEERIRELRTVSRRQDEAVCRELLGVSETWCDMKEGLSGINLAVGVGHLGENQIQTGNASEGKVS